MVIPVGKGEVQQMKLIQRLKEDDFKYGIVWPKSEVSIGARDIYKHKFNFFTEIFFKFIIIT